MSEVSVYDMYAPKLMTCGAYPLVIGPSTKKPQHFVPSLNLYQDTAGWTHPARKPVTSPQPGAGIGIRLGPQPDGTHAVALDLDDDTVALAALEAFPPTVIKEGMRGLTLFYRSLEPVPSKNFRLNGATAVQILSEGRQTVLPPSIHPDLGRPYSWSSKHTLYDTPICELPTLPEDYVARIEGILQPLGYEAEPKKKPRAESEEGNPFQEINSAALANLAAWVPALGLYKCQQKSYRYPSYVAVAVWRASNTGKPTEEREPNLKITSRGIVDFGDGDKGYSPIDLVMAARGCSRADAIGWLQERLYKDGPEIDFEALGGAGDGSAAKGADEPERETRSDRPEEEPPKGDGAKKAKPKFNFEWFGDIRIGDEPPWLIEEIIPLRGIVLVWGKPKSLKSFLLLSASVHIAEGWKFHGRAVKQGAVAYLAFEGGHGYSKRIEALRIHHELDNKVPLVMLRGGACLIADHKVLIRELKDKAGGQAPVLVVLDTLNRSLTGSENNPEDMGNYMRAAEAVRNAFDCVVVIVHHCGWNEERPRGHSSQQGTIDAELAVAAEGEMVVAEVMLMRDGPAGGRIIGRRKQIQVGEDANGKPLTSLVIEPAEDAGPATEPPKFRQWPSNLKVFHSAVIEALLSFGVPHQIPNGPTVRAVDVNHVFEVFSKTYAVKAKDGSTPQQIRQSRALAFARALEKAQQQGLIAARVEGIRQIVWLASVFEEQSHAI